MSATNKNHDVLIKRIDDWQYKLDGFDYFDSAEAECLIADCRAALSQSEPARYVPMTDDDFMQIDISTGMHDPKEAWAYERNIEAEVIRRAGLEIQE